MYLGISILIYARTYVDEPILIFVHWCIYSDLCTYVDGSIQIYAYLCIYSHLCTLVYLFSCMYVSVPILIYVHR